MHIPGLTDNGDTTSIADTTEFNLMSLASLDANSTPHIPSQRTSPIKIAVTMLPTLILLITLGTIVTALVCLRKHTRKGKLEASSIQCQENSAYQEVKHGNRVDHIQCPEDSAYLESNMSMNFSVEKTVLIKNVVLSNSTLKLTTLKAQIQITKNVICKT